MTAADAAVEAVATTEALLIALDFDGTLSPLVDEPMSARMTPDARAVLDELAGLPSTTVALVSGRTLADLRVIAEHDDSSSWWLMGSHGAESWEPGAGAVDVGDDPDDRALRDRLTAAIRDAVADLPGVRVEPKEFGLGLHTERRMPRPPVPRRRRPTASWPPKPRRGGAARVTTSSNSRSGTRARTPPSPTCASDWGRARCCSPATT